LGSLVNNGLKLVDFIFVYYDDGVIVMHVILSYCHVCWRI